MQKENKLVELKCQVCHNLYMGEEPRMCCSGRECGCMGQPIDPMVCSEECYQNIQPTHDFKNGSTFLYKEDEMKDLISRLNDVNKMLDLHSENHSKFMYNQYVIIRDEIIENILKII